jgi:hypothetical protein
MADLKLVQLAERFGTLMPGEVGAYEEATAQRLTDAKINQGPNRGKTVGTEVGTYDPETKTAKYKLKPEEITARARELVANARKREMDT